jgi:hypothetical protein
MASVSQQARCNMGTYHKSAVAIGDLKNAALYFDTVVPVFVVAEFAREHDWNLSTTKKIFGDLLPREILTLRFAEVFAEINQRGFNHFAKLSIRKFGFEPSLKGLSQKEYDSIEEDFVRAYFSFIEEFGLSNWPLATEDGPATSAMPDDEKDDALPLLTLSRLRLIDASKLPWEHIHEIRKDPIARDRLRRLRLFSFENYSGKARAFVEDDLQSRISDYEASARACGLETVQGALSLVLNSKLAAGAMAGGLVSALFGQPLTALVAGTAGAVLEVGGFVLELQKRRLAIEQLARENPVSYISYVQKRISSLSK